mmetsp:Transcript_12806/g.24998  ORF Transcript_12806/g.24998 Transcript_12806/m.24998 type:complete len:152 (+) Transcript_12806:239-694(+)
MEGIGKGGQWMPRISAKLSVEERSNWSEGHQHRSWRDRVVQTDRTNKDMVVVGSFKEEKEKERERERAGERGTGKIRKVPWMVSVWGGASFFVSGVCLFLSLSACMSLLLSGFRIQPGVRRGAEGIRKGKSRARGLSLSGQGVKPLCCFRC